MNLPIYIPIYFPRIALVVIIADQITAELTYSGEKTFVFYISLFYKG